MKTKLFIAAFFLIISISSFAQSSKKGYDYYKSKSDLGTSSNKMNKGELIDAIAKEINPSRIGRNPQTGKEIKIAAKNVSKNNGRVGIRSAGSNQKFHTKQEFGQTRGLQHLRKRSGRTKATDYNSSRSNKNTNH